MPCYRHPGLERRRAWPTQDNPGPWTYRTLCGVWTNAVWETEEKGHLDAVDCPNCIRAHTLAGARARRRRRSRAR